MQHVIDAAVNMGLHYEPTPPFEPNTNPSELAIQHVVSAAKALLAQAKLDDYYLPFAMDYACYVHYRMASTATRGGGTPYELIKGIKPDISKLVPFGTLAYANMSKEKKASKAAQAKRKGEH